MAHPHKIYDGDPYFVIEPITRAITNRTNKKITLMQLDHNSERFTFEIPRMIEGHDMSLCDRIEVHYLNIGYGTENINDIDYTTKVTNRGICEVKDAHIIGDGDKAVVVGSWLISQNATKLVGSLNFVVRYTCTAADGSLEYVWSTAIYSGITVSNGIYNSDAVVEQYTDVLEQWKIELEQLARVPGATKEEFDQLARDFNKYTQDTDDTITELDGRVKKIENSGGGATADCAKVFLPDETPQKPKDGDLHIKRVKADGGLPFVTEPQMRRYVDGKIPAVPYWAMQPNKPTYTAKEVGAATIDDIDEALANLPAGGTDKWEFIGEFNSGDEDVSSWYITEDAEGKPIELKKMYWEQTLQPIATATADYDILFGNPANVNALQSNAVFLKDKIYLTPRKQQHFALYYPMGDTGNAATSFCKTSAQAVSWKMGISDYNGITKQCLGGIAIASTLFGTELCIGAGSKIKIWGVRM